VLGHREAVDDVRNQRVQIHLHRLFPDPSRAGVLQDALDQVVHPADAVLEQIELLLRVVAELVPVVGAQPFRDELDPAKRGLQIVRDHVGEMAQFLVDRVHLLQQGFLFPPGLTLLRDVAGDEEDMTTVAVVANQRDLGGGEPARCPIRVYDRLFRDHDALLGDHHLLVVPAPAFDLFRVQREDRFVSAFQILGGAAANFGQGLVGKHEPTVL